LIVVVVDVLMAGMGYPDLCTKKMMSCLGVMNSIRRRKTSTLFNCGVHGCIGPEEGVHHPLHGHEPMLHLQWQEVEQVGGTKADLQSTSLTMLTLLP